MKSLGIKPWAFLFLQNYVKDRLRILGLASYAKAIQNLILKRLRSSS